MLRSGMVRVFSTLGFVSALFCTPHCATKETDDSVATNEPDTVDHGVVLSAATWSLGWKNEGVQFDAAGGFTLTNDLGYRIHVDVGDLVLHRVALVPCSQKTEQTAFFPFISINAAFAHEETSDPSSMETLALSEAGQSKTMEIGANAFAPVRYCQAYWLVARGMAGAVATEGLDMSNRSIYFSGTWERDGQSGKLLIDTWWPMGTFVDLKAITEAAVYENATKEDSVHFGWIKIDIALRRVFDGIDFAVDSEEIVADSVLDNIIATAELTADLRTP